MNQIAMMGLGAMGIRMAKRCLDAGLKVVVYNRSPEKAKALVEQGATFAETPRQAASMAKIAIGMVTDDKASRTLWTHPEYGALLGLHSESIAIESSTLTPAWIAQLAQHMKTKEVPFLDAPVAGSRPQAEAGSLIYLVGGPERMLAKVREILGHMGQTIHHVGPVGAGSVMKLAVNAFFGMQVAALSEVMGLLEHANFPRERSAEVLGSLPITSPAMQGIGKLIAKQIFTPMFPIELVEKDFSYVVKTAENMGLALPIAHATHQVYSKATEQGLGQENIQGIAKLYNKS